MQSYTFASDDAMAAVLAAFDASGDDTYDTTMQYWGTDMRALVVALANAAAANSFEHATTARLLLRGIAEGLGWSPADALVLVSEYNIAAVVREMSVRAQEAAGVYCGAWNRAELTAVSYSLRLLWEATPEDDSDGSVYDNAGSLLSGIAQSLGIEFV